MYGSLWKEVIVQRPDVTSSYVQDYGLFGAGVIGKPVSLHIHIYMYVCICMCKYTYTYLWCRRRGQTSESSYTRVYVCVYMYV